MIIDNNTSWYKRKIYFEEYKLNELAFKIVDNLKKEKLGKMKSNYWFIRGDIIDINNGIINIYECKNYNQIQTRMKPSNKLEQTKFFKTFDSHIEKNILFYNTFFEPKFTINTKTITKKQFLNFYKINELGLISLIYNINYKHFYLLSKEGYIEQYKLDLINFYNKLSDNLELNFYIDEKTNYQYLDFISNNNIIYSISTRNNNKSNCAFLNKEYLKKENNISCSFNKMTSKNFEQYILKNVI